MSVTFEKSRNFWPHPAAFAQKMSHQPSPLLLLPRELRDAIYMLVFKHDPLIRVFEDGATNRPFPALPQSCHQIYLEAYPILIRSLNFVISAGWRLDATQCWLEHIGDNGIKAVRTVAVTVFALLRTFPPGQRCMLWTRDECNPLTPGARIGPKIHITGSDAPRAPFATIPKAMRFLLGLPGLRHIDIGIHVKLPADAVDKLQRGEKHYYDLHSLTAITTLRSVTLHLDNRLLARIWRNILKKKDRERGPTVIRRKEVLEDAWGLRSWLADGFRQKGLNVDVKCVWVPHEVYLHSVIPQY
ncbi:hypothetical protein EK21DRAFT_83901 [Setomelanomma holmii]|uniref:Uncharacterized protein n=1 Tax=Setomelanomma holmii TaxID=210430 RepID=A0A9P4LTW1_9PLEO|nr:hypothetical protein EK21DRAFT_83901 [Setomelanomma holmii]